ncbi:MAG: RluA family pseudouridine synthase [Saprospiraceae bacterium]|nr:RluA family pseudouridine synthase [Saprospiraceae bacterium]
MLGSRSAAKKAVKAGRLFVNGRKATSDDFVEHGDLIELRGGGARDIKPYLVDLEVVYQDEYMLIINKPGGLAVNGNRYKTVENATARMNLNNPEPDALPRPISVHRIDVPTCGLVILAKTKRAQIKLSKDFQDKKISKKYLAVVHGCPLEQGRISDPIGGKKAITEYRRLNSVRSRLYEHLSLMELMPITGRTHQLRIHLRDLGHLVAGDRMYAADTKTIWGKGLLLCACQLQFDHPITAKKMKIQIEPPPKFKRVMDWEMSRYKLAT